MAAKFDLEFAEVKMEVVEVEEEMVVVLERL